ncbi:MAG TPA: ASCH domain-containing protein [Thermoleophilaceae bacterium]|nr:ASCH domain-containing protein [Thermoleophilaceae bacterium]
MNFKQHLADQILVGEKTVTRREPSPNPNSPWWVERCAYIPGRDYAICPGRGKNAVGRMLVVSVEKVRLGWLDDAEAANEGFATAYDFTQLWASMRKGGIYDPRQKVWRVEFELLAVAAEPFPELAESGRA